jgi:hypothetical protein
MPYLVDHTIQAVILLAVAFCLPGLLQLPGYWSGFAVFALCVIFTAWAWHRGNDGRGPLW